LCRWSVNIGALEDNSTSLETEPPATSSSRKKRGPTTSKSKDHNSVLGEVGLLGMAANNPSLEETGAPQRKKPKAVKKSSPQEEQDEAPPVVTGGRRGATRSQKKGGGSDSLFSLK
jgi:hypothetical protein